jgi:hypothetical protein
VSELTEYQQHTHPRRWALTVKLKPPPSSHTLDWKYGGFRQSQYVPYVVQTLVAPYPPLLLDTVSLCTLEAQQLIPPRSLALLYVSGGGC